MNLPVISSCLIATTLLSPVASGQVDCQEQLVCANSAALDSFGEQVAIAGDTAALGGPNSGLDGAVCLFERVGGQWAETVTLVHPNGTGGEDGFGYSLALDGNLLVVGAPFEDQSSGFGRGAVYIYSRSSATGQWTLRDRLAASGLTSPDDRFGISVDIQGASLIVGAVGDDTVAFEAGAAYIFRFAQGQWFQEVKVLPSSVQQSMRFGLGVAMASGRAIIGAPFESVGGFLNAGAAYIFERQPNTSWPVVAQLTSPNPASSTFFGVGVDIDGNGAVVGEEGGNNGAGVNSGLAYTYRRLSGGGWGLESTLSPSSPAANETFGNQVAMDGDFVIASARGDATNGTLGGAAHVFQRSGVNWFETELLLSPSGGAFENFGSGVTLDGAVAMVGSPGTGINGINSGAATLFDIGLSDCNGNGEPDSCDILNGAATDCNGNGIPDSCDVASGQALDCNGNGLPDSCDVLSGAALDCNGNGIPDLCDLASGAAQDCNMNGVPDSCDVAAGTSLDCNGDGIPDECQTGTLDCNSNGLIDSCEILAGLAADANGNLVPDECETIGTPYCLPAAPNSFTTAGSQLTAFGTALASSTDVTLMASDLPRNQFGLWLNSQAPGLTPFPQGSVGILCLGGAIGRFNGSIMSSGPEGVIELNLNLTSLPRPNGSVAVLPGQTWFFQAWHRDFINNTGTSNFTPGIEITFN